MSVNISNLVIDRILRGVMFNTSTREAMWNVSQISSFSISVSSDKRTAVDATETPIMDFYRAKTCTVTAENALWDLGLFAAQGGSALETSSADNKFNVPAFDEIKLTDATAAVLTYVPVAPNGADRAVPFVYVLNGDGTLGKKLVCGDAAAVGVFAQTGKNLTFFEGDLKVGETIIVFYEHEADGTVGNQALAMKNTAKDFPRAGRFVMEVLCCDPCDKSTLYYAYLIMPSATLSPDVDLDFSTDAKHSFALDAQQDYCDHEKRLYELIVPEAITA